MMPLYRFPKWLFEEEYILHYKLKPTPHFFVTLEGKGAQSFTGVGHSVVEAAKKARKQRDAVAPVKSQRDILREEGVIL
jgi:hypothetical protein